MKYRIYCDTEKKHVFVESDTLPTECPNSKEHNIHEDKTVILPEPSVDNTEIIKTIISKVNDLIDKKENIEKIEVQ